MPKEYVKPSVHVIGDANRNGIAPENIRYIGLRLFKKMKKDKEFIETRREVPVEGSRAPSGRACQAWGRTGDRVYYTSLS